MSRGRLDRPSSKLVPLLKARRDFHFTIGAGAIESAAASVRGRPRTRPSGNGNQRLKHPVKSTYFHTALRSFLEDLGAARSAKTAFFSLLGHRCGPGGDKEPRERIPRDWDGGHQSGSGTERDNRETLSKLTL
jgi:hypothetical protein